MGWLCLRELGTAVILPDWEANVILPTNNAGVKRHAPYRWMPFEKRPQRASTARKNAGIQEKRLARPKRFELLAF
jgi:hypothetical protein